MEEALIKPFDAQSMPDKMWRCSKRCRGPEAQRLSGVKWAHIKSSLVSTDSEASRGAEVQQEVQRCRNDIQLKLDRQPMMMIDAR